jgi:hypothetical protein
MGDTARAVRFYREQIEKLPNNLDLRFRLAGVFERTGQNLESLEQLEYIMRADPESRDAVMAAVGLSLRANVVTKARQYLAEWLRTHPGDDIARQALDDIDGQFGSDSSAQ